MPFLLSTPVQSPAVPASQNPSSVAARAPETHFYRPRGNPFQKLPKSIHSHSHSLSASSIFSSSSCASTNSPQDIVARILAQDEIPRGTFMAAEKEKEKAAKAKRCPAPGPLQVHVQQQTTTSTCTSSTNEEKRDKTYPERLDSRRALLSVINGPKAPIVFKGFTAPAVSLPPVPTMPAPKPPVVQTQTQQQPSQPQQPQATTAPVSTTAAVSYMHKQLPPTPPSSSSQGSTHEPSANPASDTKQQQSRALPPIRPLNLDLKQNNPLNANRLGLATTKETLAKRRFSRILSTNSRISSSRFRAAVPAPIKPPRFLGPSAFNGPSSANTSEEELDGGKSSHLELFDQEEEEEDEDDLFGVYARDQDQRRSNAQQAALEAYHEQHAQMLLLSKKVATPMGELPITPLDIPVDWDDLRDQWTSPVMITHHVETATLDQLLHEALEGIDAEEVQVGDELDLSDAFHDKVVVISHHQEEQPEVLDEVDEEEKVALERQAFAAFQEDVAELFRGSPTRTATDDWKTEGSSSIRRLTSLTVPQTLTSITDEKEPNVVTASPISSCSASFNTHSASHSPALPGNVNEASKDVSPSSSTTNLSEGGAGGEKEKRHGRVLVKKELKLCINIDTSYVNSSAVIDRDEYPSIPQKLYRGHHRCREDPKAGESFLMMSPESASTRASAIAW